MKFSEIIDALVYGRKVRRTSWDKSIYFTSDGNNIKCYLSGKNGDILIHPTEKLSLDDVTAEDWEIIS